MKHLQLLKTKPIISFVVCLFLCSCQNDEILDQKPASDRDSMSKSEILKVASDQNDSLNSTSEESVKAEISGSEAQLQDLILRYRTRWTSEGYTIVEYREAKAKNIIPSEVRDRFQNNLGVYANHEYDQEGYAFILYKYDLRYSANVYVLQVLEDCYIGVIPNKYTQADFYINR